MQERIRRTGAIKATMDLPTLLDAYFESKDELKERKDILIKKALELAQEKDNNA